MQTHRKQNDAFTKRTWNSSGGCANDVKREFNQRQFNAILSEIMETDNGDGGGK